MRFDQPLDLCSIANAHHADDDFTNDVIYVVDVETGEPVRLDLNRGFSPTCCRATATQTRPSASAHATTPTMARAGSSTLIFDDHPEDANGNGVLDPGEDSDQTLGVLDGLSAKRCRAVKRAVALRREHAVGSRLKHLTDPADPTAQTGTHLRRDPHECAPRHPER